MKRVAAVGLLVIALGLALGVGGCGPTAGDRTPARSASAAVATAQRTHEYPAAHAAPPQPVRSPSSEPATAVRAFAALYINWTAFTVTGRLRLLASLSLGQARAAMTLAAAQTARDYELRRSGVANQGTVEAVSSLGGSATRFIVVTREQTTASASTAYRGLRPAWHVALATVARVGARGWAISGWQPEN